MLKNILKKVWFAVGTATKLTGSVLIAVWDKVAKATENIKVEVIKEKTSTKKETLEETKVEKEKIVKYSEFPKYNREFKNYIKERFSIEEKERLKSFLKNWLAFHKKNGNKIDKTPIVIIKEIYWDLNVAKNKIKVAKQYGKNPKISDLFGSLKEISIDEFKENIKAKYETADDVKKDTISHNLRCYLYQNWYKFSEILEEIYNKKSKTLLEIIDEPVLNIKEMFSDTVKQISPNAPVFNNWKYVFENKEMFLKILKIAQKNKIDLNKLIEGVYKD